MHVDRWTGRETRALREALRLSVRDFAARLGIGTRTVAKWESRRETIYPRPEMQAVLDTALSQLSDDAETRFGALLRATARGEVGPSDEPPAAGVVAGEHADAGLVATSDDGITVPCRAADGRIVFVSVPRRAFLLGAVGAAFAAGEPPPARLRHRQPGWATAGRSSEPSPVEAFEQLRGMLVDQDNLAGPEQVLPTVREQVRLIHQLRRGSDGADRRALLHVQAQYAELAGWLSQDLGDFHGAQVWLSQALEWAEVVGDRDMVAYVLARKAQLAGDMTDPLTAIDMAEAAKHCTQPRSRLNAAAAAYGAYGHALTGDAVSCERAIDAALSHLLDAEDTGSAWAPWLDRSYLDVQAGRCHTALGQHVKAIAAYQNALDALPARYRRDRGVYLGRQALAHVGAGAIERAAALGIQAVDIALVTGSQRIVGELARVDTEISRWVGCPAVAAFREALNTVILHEA